MNSKMTTQLSTIESKKKPKQTTRHEQNHRSGDHMEGYQWGAGQGRMGEKVQEKRSIIGRYKMDRERLRIV